MRLEYYARGGSAPTPPVRRACRLPPGPRHARQEYSTVTVYEPPRSPDAPRNTGRVATHPQISGHPSSGPVNRSQQRAPVAVWTGPNNTCMIVWTPWWTPCCGCCPVFASYRPRNNSLHPVSDGFNGVGFSYSILYAWSERRQLGQQQHRHVPPCPAPSASCTPSCVVSSSKCQKRFSISRTLPPLTS